MLSFLRQAGIASLFFFVAHCAIGGGVQNFGIVVDNPTYHIYRSAELGREGIEELARLGIAPRAIVYMNWEGYAFPFYFALQEYEESLLRGFTFYHPHGDIRTYLDGENPYSPTDRIDSIFKFGFKARRIFKKGDNEIVGDTEALLKILNLILDPQNQPVLFHCFGGMHRTGMVAMLIRSIQGWNWDRIEAEYVHYNPHLFRQENVDFVEAFSEDPRFLELVKKYRDLLKQ